MLVGQKRLKRHFIKLLNRFSLPNTIILIGERGQGKRTLAKWLAEQLGAPVYVPEDLKIDSIREMNNDSRTISSPKLYLLADAEDMTMQAQNALLKLAEEPPSNAYIVITVQDPEILLPTILSRSATFRLDGYTREDLLEFTEDEELIAVAGNPGTIKRYQSFTSFHYRDLLKHTRKVVAHIAEVSASNAFNILRAVDKEHLDLFLSMLVYSYGERLKEGHNCAKQLEVVYETKTLLDRHSSINRSNAIEMMLVKLRGAARNEIQ